MRCSLSKCAAPDEIELRRSIIVDFCLSAGTSAPSRECGLSKSKYVPFSRLVLWLSLGVIFCDMISFVGWSGRVLFGHVHLVLSEARALLCSVLFIFLLQILVYRWFNTTELNGKPSLFSKAKQLLGMNVNHGQILVSGWYLWRHFLTRVWLDVSYFPASIIWMSLSQVEDFSQNYLTLSFKLPFVFLTSSR